MSAPYAKPFRQRVLTALTDALKTITPTNGYKTNLADDLSPTAKHPSRVFRGRAWFGDNDPIPMISVLEAPDEADDLIDDEPFDNKQGGGTWRLFVQGFVSDDPYNPTDPAYALLADVRRCLLAERKRKHSISRNQSDPLGMGVVSANGSGNAVLAIRKVGKGTVRPADDVSAKAYFWMTLDIDIIENGDKPYD